MENIQDFYKIIGTNRYAIDYDYITGKQRSIEEKDKFVKEKYEHEIKMLKMKIEYVDTTEEKRKLEDEIKMIEYAYSRVKDEISRDMYSKELKEREETTKKQEITLPKETNAYQILNTSKALLENKTEEEKDRKLKQTKDRYIERYNEMLLNAKSFSEREKIKLQISLVLNNYEKISTSEKREKYNSELEEKEEKRQEIIRDKKIQQKFDHSNEYEESLIESEYNQQTGKKEGKAIVIEEQEESEKYCPDKEKRNLRIQQKAKISYENALQGKFHFYEYEIKRIINRKEKLDTIYSDIQYMYLGRDKETGNPDYPEFYDAIVNRLLAEDTIEGSKYNGGYIGSVVQNEKGEYILTIEKEKLVGMDREMLTVAMMIDEHKKEKDDKKGER